VTRQECFIDFRLFDCDGRLYVSRNSMSALAPLNVAIGPHRVSLMGRNCPFDGEPASGPGAVSRWQRAFRPKPDLQRRHLKSDRGQSW